MKNIQRLLFGTFILLSNMVWAQWPPIEYFEERTLDIPADHNVDDKKHYNIKVSERLSVARGTTSDRTTLEFNSKAYNKEFHAKIDLNHIADEETQTGHTQLFSTNTKTWDESKEVGFIPGVHSVDAVGGFNYTIPIQVSPGSNGVAPQISINYSSNVETGVLGPGWSIGGLSAISRTSKNNYYDGITEPLLLNVTDPFTLDGARLIKDGSANIYRFEKEDYSEIKPYGGDNTTGPDTWEFVSQNGTKIEYGGTPNSKISYGLVNISWLISKTTDLNGNYIEYKYRLENDQVLLDEIWYTGNGSSTPYNKIKFTYVQKDNIVKRYYKGYEIKDEHLIDRIITYSHGSAILEYSFQYQTLSELYRDHNNVQHTTDFEKPQLMEVTLKSLIGGEEYHSTLFRYNKTDNEKGHINSPLSGVKKEDKPSIFMLGDFNNDGLTDVADFELNISTSKISSLTKKFNNGNNSFSGSTNISSFSNAYAIDLKDYWDAFNKTIRSTDMDGDGDDDLLIGQNILNSSIRISRILDNSIDSRYMNIPTADSNEYSFGIGDVTGDGIPEAIAFSKKSNQTYGQFIIKNYDTDLVQTQGTVQTNSIWPSSTAQDIGVRNITPFDYDGDGTVEILFWDYDNLSKKVNYKILDITKNASQYSYSIVELATGSDFVGEEDFKYLQVGDFNGDGISDFMAFSEKNATSLVDKDRPRLITHDGDGNFTKAYINRLYDTNDQWFFIDVNGDRMSDLIRIHEDDIDTNKTALKVNYSTGSSFNENRYRDIEIDFDDLSNFSFGDFNGDNAIDLFYVNTLNPDPNPTVGYSLIPSAIQMATGPKNFKLHQVRNGLNHDIEVKYAYNSEPGTRYNIDSSDPDTYSTYDGVYTDKSLFNIPSTLSLPDGYVVLNKQLLMVQHIKTPIAAQSGNDNDAIYDFTEKYTFAEAIFNKEGKGLIGFTESVVKMPYEGVRKTNISSFNSTSCNCLIPEAMYTNEYKATYSESLTAKLYNSLEHTITTSSLSGGKRYEQFTTQNELSDYVKGSKTITDYTYFIGGTTHGNLKKTVVNNGVYETTTEIKSYGKFGTPNPEHPTEIQVIKDNLGYSGTYSTTTELDYFTNGNLKQKITNVGTAKVITTDYTYDNYGNTLTTTTSASGMPTLVSSAQMDQYGQFIEWSENIKGQKTYYETWKPFGLPLSVTTPDNNTVSHTYNGFGRKVSSTDPNGNVTHYETKWNKENGTIGIKELYYEEVSSPGSPKAKTFYDFLGREVKSEVEGWNEKIISTTKYYQQDYQQDGISPYKIKEVTIPRYASNSTIVSKKYEYDELQRLKRIFHSNTQFGEQLITNPDVQAPSFTFPSNHKYTVTVNGFDGNNTSNSFNPANELIEATDNGGTLTYIYNDQGLQTEIKLGSTIMAKMGYDPIDGTQDSLKDANAVAATKYEYDTYGRLIKQWDNKSTTDLYYNNYNELTSKVNSELGTITYSYINNGNGLNQISSIIHSNGSEEHFLYDNLGRNTQYEKKIDNETYSYTYSYNQLGQLVNETYPSGFAINSQYTTKGFLEKVIDAGSGTIIWEGKEMNHLGQYVEVEKGDGQTTTYTFDQLGQPKTIRGPLNFDYTFNLDDGNLDIWTNNTINKYENFDYDNLNRLEEIVFNGTPTTTVTRNIEYYNNGNIKKKEELLTSTTKGSLNNYTYGSKPNAVTSIKDPNDIISDDVQNIVYNALHQPKTITEGDDSYRLNLTYGADGQRLNAVLDDDGTLIWTRTYLPNYEKQKFHSNNKEQEIHYIAGGDGLAAIYVIENEVGTMYYTYTDYLGSILKITDNTGTVIEEQSFDAWGRKRNASDWTYASIAPTPDWLIRGYTGHEHYEEFELINMNGRMYDPIISRMLSIDNYVQDNTSTQNYNRYSYVHNNPLKYTDPDGEFAIAFVAFMAVGTMSHFSGNKSSKVFRQASIAALTVGTAGVGKTISASGIPFANTASIVTSSSLFSAGQSILTKGQSDISVNFGAGSYNFNDRELQYLGKKGNSILDNIVYALGAIANVNDILAGFNPSEIELQTENISRPGEKDKVGHNQTNKDGKVLMDYGPNEQMEDAFDVVPGTNSYEDGLTIEQSLKQYGIKNNYSPIKVNGININRYERIVNRVSSNPGNYRLFTNNCVSHCSSAFRATGFINLGIHPYSLHAQAYLRSIGVRPSIYSHFLTHFKK